jgi:hypothetical protein
MGEPDGSHHQLDPSFRQDVQLDKQFVGTIKDHGVLVPIVAIDTPNGCGSGSVTAAPLVGLIG